MSSSALEMEPKADWSCTSQRTSFDEKMSEQAPVKWSYQELSCGYIRGSKSPRVHNTCRNIEGESIIPSVLENNFAKAVSMEISTGVGVDQGGSLNLCSRE